MRTGCTVQKHSYCTRSQVTELEVALADSQAQAQQTAAVLAEAQAQVGVNKFGKFAVAQPTKACKGVRQEQASSRHTVSG